jgi:hypothetical protein
MGGLGSRCSSASTTPEAGSAARAIDQLGTQAAIRLLLRPLLLPLF